MNPQWHLKSLVISQFFNPNYGDLYIDQHGIHHGPNTTTWSQLSNYPSVTQGLYFYKMVWQQPSKQYQLDWLQGKNAKQFKQKLFELWSSHHFPILIEFSRTLNQHLAQYYLTQKQFAILQKQALQLVKSWPDTFNDLEIPQTIIKCYQFIEQFSRWQHTQIEQHHQHYIKQQCKIYKPLFNELKLNQQQQIAVITNDTNNLILASAGSGKTLVIIARALYLIESGQCIPSEILILVFGKDAKEEIKQRLKLYKPNLDFNVHTFHSFALKSANTKMVNHKKELIGNTTSYIEQFKKYCSNNNLIYLDLMSLLFAYAKVKSNKLNEYNLLVHLKLAFDNVNINYHSMMK
ncbi:UvrD-helicase domain-containing protein [Shewanella marina]|uniref:UvrD-helicase domain-containing protein n=1 Tax=Shewanella marina TaxID=487319 RepID=UPI000472EC2E|nr:UvrD-helicase domain-containing protein [Shewanella marina]